MRILASLVFPFLLPLAAAEGDGPLDISVERYLADERPLLAPAEGGVLGWFTAQLHGWYPSLEGEVSADSGDILDFDTDLGLDDNVLTVMPQIQVTFLGIGFRIDAFFLELDGSNTITRTFDFGGVPFQLNEQVRSEISIEHARLMFMVPFIDSDKVALSVQLGVALLMLDGMVTGELSGQATESQDIPVPLVGVVLHVHAGRFLIEVDVAGFTIDYSDVEGTLFDARISVGITLFKVVGVHVGYRHMIVEGDASDFHLDATISGFFAGVSVQF